MSSVCLKVTLGRQPSSGIRCEALKSLLLSCLLIDLELVCVTTGGCLNFLESTASEANINRCLSSA